MVNPTDKIIQAFQPITAIAQGVAHPLAFLMICYGMMLVMIGERNKGIDKIKWAMVGYLGIQYAPSIMKILAEIGWSLR